MKSISGKDNFLQRRVDLTKVYSVALMVLEISNGWDFPYKPDTVSPHLGEFSMYSAELVPSWNIVSGDTLSS